ncbi:MAG: DUF4932 domain-containing protein [Candidatus Latescibacterota bacterium]
MLSPPPSLSLPQECQSTWAGSSLPGLDSVLAELYASADLGALWQEHLPSYKADAARSRPLVARSLQATWDYLRAPMDARHGSVRVVPNLLMAYHCATVFVHPSSGTVHVVRGACTEGGRYDLAIAHELLHTVVDAAVEGSLHLVLGQGELMTLVQDLPTIRDNYGGSLLQVVTESLVRALTKRLARDAYTPAEAERETLREYGQGFVLIRHFVEQLAAKYEMDDRPLVLVLPEMLAAVDTAVEQERWSC